MIDQRSPLRRAYEAGNYIDVLRAIKKDTVEDNGCWIWQRKTRQSRKDGSPYPEVRIAGRDYGVHRLRVGGSS